MRRALALAAVTLVVSPLACSPAATTAVTAAPCPAPSAPAAPPARSANANANATVDEVARDVVAKMNAKDAKGIFAMFSRTMQRAFPLGLTTEFVDGTIDAKGPIKDFARVEGDDAHALYVLRAERGEWQLSLHADDGQIVGFRINEAPPPEPPLAQSPPFALPVRGKWLVAWGGATPEDNPHLGAPDQRRAADLVIAGADGKHFKTDGKKNDDYLAYGQDVLAVADGTVVTVVDGVPENVPGQLDAGLAYGNVVVVEHGKSLFGVYAHLQPGKIRVKVGQKVKAGATLGLVGNSGNASEPHLHLQLQDNARIASAWGIEATFAKVSVTRDGKTETPATYVFKKGDVIEVAAPAPGAKPVAK